MLATDDKKKMAALVILLCSLALGPRTMGRGQDLGDDEGWEAENRAAKDFSVKDLDGRRLRARDLVGKVVVVDFWATWCGPCIQELPDLLEYQRRIDGRKDLVFLSFNATDEREDVEDFVRKHRVSYPVYLADDSVGPYEIFAFPTKLVIDMREKAPGVIRFRRIGFTPIESLEARVAEVLASRP